MRAYLVFSTAPVVALNSGRPLNLALNVAFVLVLWWALCWLARPSFAAENGIPIVAFGRWGFLGLCAYLTLLYGITYRFLRFEALPSVPIQMLTFVFYAIAVLGIYGHRRRAPLAARPVSPKPRERFVVVSVFALVIGLGFILAILPYREVILIPFVISSVLWPVLGFLFTGFAVWQGIREFRDRALVYASG
jgi:hypothetical protein